MTAFQFVKNAYPFGCTITLHDGWFSHASKDGIHAPMVDEFDGRVIGGSARLMQAVEVLRPHEQS